MLFYDFSTLNEIYGLKIIRKGMAFLVGSLGQNWINSENLFHCVTCNFLKSEFQY